MNIQKNIEQIYYINKEIKNLDAEIKLLENTATERGKALSPKVERELIEIIKVIKRLEIKVKEEQTTAYKFISLIEDPIIKQIIEIKFFNPCTWYTVADYIGGNNNAACLRVMYNRYIKKHIHKSKKETP